jgi:hypothetical protein
MNNTMKKASLKTSILEKSSIVKNYALSRKIPAGPVEGGAPGALGPAVFGRRIVLNCFRVGRTISPQPDRMLTVKASYPGFRLLILKYKR